MWAFPSSLSFFGLECQFGQFISVWKSTTEKMYDCTLCCLLFLNMIMFLQMKTQEALGSHNSTKQTWQTLIILYNLLYRIEYMQYKNYSYLHYCFHGIDKLAYNLQIDVSSLYLTFWDPFRKYYFPIVSPGCIFDKCLFNTSFSIRLFLNIISLFQFLKV